jgi:SPOR domain
VISILVMSLFYDLLSRAEKNRAEQAGRTDLSRRTHVSGHLLTTVPAVTVACIAFLIGYYWRAARASLSAPQNADAAQPFPSARIPLRPVTPTPAAAQHATAIPGFVLQVAAMEKETNADILCQALRQEDFSAFVFRLATDRFYRVAVGPFSEVPPAEIRHQLEAKGLKPFVRSWRPDGSMTIH